MTTGMARSVPSETFARLSYTNMPSSDSQVRKYHRLIESSALGAVKVLDSAIKDPSAKLRDKFKSVDDAVRNFKKAARQAAREKREKNTLLPAKRKAPVKRKKPEAFDDESLSAYD